MFIIGLYRSLWHDSILQLMTITYVLAVNYYTGTCQGIVNIQVFNENIKNMPQNDCFMCTDNIRAKCVHPL